MDSSPNLSRRAFLRYSAGGAMAVLGGAVLTKPAPTQTAGALRGLLDAATPNYGTFTLQVNWLAGAGWEGSYVAQKAGVYQKEGFSGGLDILYGGPNVAVEPVIESGKALMGICNSETFAGAVRQGASLVAIGAYLQHNPFCIASLPKTPIHTPKEMIGKKIGIQALNEGEWDAMLRVNHIARSSVTKVIVQNDPTPLVNGEVDGFLSFVDNQPITLELEGYKPVIMMLDDFGFTLYEQVYAVTRDSLAHRKDEVIAGLKCEIIGKQMVAKNPAAAAALTLAEFGKSAGLTAPYEDKSLSAALQLATSPSTQAHGVMYMSPSDIAKNVATLKLLGLGIPASSYTDEVLNAIYAKGMNLV